MSNNIQFKIVESSDKSVFLKTITKYVNKGWIVVGYNTRTTLSTSRIFEALLQYPSNNVIFFKKQKEKCITSITDTCLS